MSLRCGIIQQADRSFNLTLVNDDGVERKFKVDKEAGPPMYVVCGPNYDYTKNGVRHAHYIGFERDLFVYDGKYLRKIGTPTA